MKHLCLFIFLCLAMNLEASSVRAGDPFLDKAMKAIYEGDYETIESLRDQVKAEHIPPLVKKWNKDLLWTQKDAFIALLMDQQDDLLIPMMRDGLNSPTMENRAAALCILKKDFKL